LAKAERLYEENIGDVRRFLTQEMVSFEDVLDRQDDVAIRVHASKFSEVLKNIEEQMDSPN